jgi:hypothetical protein
MNNCKLEKINYKLFAPRLNILTTFVAIKTCVHDTKSYV